MSAKVQFDNAAIGEAVKVARNAGLEIPSMLMEEILTTAVKRQNQGDSEINLETIQLLTAKAVLLNEQVVALQRKRDELQREWYALRSEQVTEDDYQHAKEQARFLVEHLRGAWWIEAAAAYESLRQWVEIE